MPNTEILKLKWKLDRMRLRMYDMRKELREYEARFERVHKDYRTAKMNEGAINAKPHDRV
jgi:hypothetical protein